MPGAIPTRPNRHDSVLRDHRLVTLLFSRLPPEYAILQAHVCGGQTTQPGHREDMEVWSRESRGSGLD